MTALLATLDGPVTWQVAGTVLVILFLGLVAWGCVAELMNPDREESDG